MSRIIVKTLAEEFHAAFEGQRVHSLIGNLEGFDPAMWRAKPQGGARSVGGLVWHAGCAKYLHHSHTFGDRSVTWAHPLCAIDNARDMDAAIVWLREGHRLFMDALLQLSDGDLDLDRPTWFGDTRPIRETVGSMPRRVSRRRDQPSARPARRVGCVGGLRSERVGLRSAVPLA